MAIAQAGHSGRNQELKERAQIAAMKRANEKLARSVTRLENVAKVLENFVQNFKDNRGGE